MLTTNGKARQGDVYVRPVKESEICEGQPIELDKFGRHILAHGEVTGHAHAITSNNVVMMKVADKLFMVVVKDADLNHEEHKTITFPPGQYLVKKQREYIQKRIIDVAD